MDCKIEIGYISNSDGSCRMTKKAYSVVSAVIGPDHRSYQDNHTNVAYFGIKGDPIEKGDYINILESCVSQSVDKSTDMLSSYNVIIHQLNKNEQLDMAINATSISLNVANVPLKWTFAAGTTDLGTVAVVNTFHDLIALLFLNQEGLMPDEFIAEIEQAKAKAEKELEYIKKFITKHVNETIT